MWPLLLDMTKEESVHNLRNLELEAYSHLVSALRAQGPLNSDKRKLLKDTSYVLNITQERHKAEIRRAISDEKLNTIAYHITGHSESVEDWAQEGRRLVPLLPRTAPQTAFSAIADEVSDTACQSNKQLPLPSSTERKRQSVPQAGSSTTPECSKPVSFRVPEPPKMDDNKKRKLPPSQENSNLAQHLLSPKLCRIQQLYRQRSKPKTKEIYKKTDQDQLEVLQQHRVVPQPQTVICSTPQSQFVGQKVNVLQNISLQPIKDETTESEENVSASTKSLENISTPPVGSNENQAPRPKVLTNIKPNTNITLKQPVLQAAGPSNEFQKSLKMCSAKKPITKTVSSGQKLIVVSNAQTITSNSILQRTLQIPFVKNVSIKNFEKFKIVTSNATPTSIQVTNVSNSGMNSVKHKVVTVKTNPTTKKVIPLSQLQVLNSKGSIKVLPLGGKIVGKTVSATSSPLYIMNTTTHQLTKNTPSSQVIATSKAQVSEEVKPKIEASVEFPSIVPSCSTRENGKSSVLEDILKASGVISEEPEDYDTKIEEFHILQNKSKNSEHETELKSIKEGKADHEQLDYPVVPMQDGGEENQMTEIKDQLFEKMETISTEIVEAETSTQLDEVTELDCGGTEIKCEEVPQFVHQVECSRTSDILEQN